MLGIGAGIDTLATARRGAIFSPLDLAPRAWFDPSDMGGLFQDSTATQPVTGDGDPVGAMLDRSGNGAHLLQSAAARRPIYREGGGQRWLEFDGMDDILTAALPLAQPASVIFAIETITPGSGATGDIVLGGTASTVTLEIDEAISIYAGAQLVSPVAPQPGDQMVLTAVFNGSGSQLRKDGAVIASGNPGTSSSASFSLGDNGFGRHARMRCFGLAIYGLLSESDTRKVEGWIARRLGL
ncbi:MAG: hypothetical protein HUJ27_12270 [Rhodobacteraceae bacterium]|nr:hypothetical protein [Paracoccaceae bacterium]